MDRPGHAPALPHADGRVAGAHGDQRLLDAAGAREKIMPYVRQPEAIVPGKPLYFATAMPLAGVATGVLVESHEGRPTKIEGNPSHPASLGATDLLTQASILGLYDPDRSQAVTYRGRPRAWNEALFAIRAALEKLKTRQGAGLYILAENVTSPTLAAQLNELLDKDHFPKAKWYQYEPAGRSTVLEGSKLAFGEYVGTRYNFEKADVVLSLDADFLLAGPGTLRYTHDYSDRRRVRTKDKKPADVKMNRLYVVECSLTNTGGVADHRLALRPSQIESFAQALAGELGVADAPKSSGELPEEARRWLQPLARDLKDNSGKCIVLAGDGQPAQVHALVHAINQTLKNVGETVLYSEPIEAKPVDHGRQIAELVEEMAAKRVEMLVILGCNPVFTAPVELEFAEQLKKVPLRIHLGQYQDETAIRCDWHIPEAHYLESWGDARAYDGMVSIIQPLIAPLFGGRSAYELLAAFTEKPERGGLEIVREHWRQWWKDQGSSGDFETFWQRSLQEGVIPGTLHAHRPRELRKGWAEPTRPARSASKGFEIVFRPDPTLFDGRFANNGWLQELPKPVTKLTWDNAALLSPKTAQKLGISYVRGSSSATSTTGGEHGHALVDVIELTYAGRKVKAPVWIQPGHADDAITIHLGHGRSTRTPAASPGASASTPTRCARRMRRGLTADWKRASCPARHTRWPARRCTTTWMIARPVRTASLRRFKEEPRFAQELEIAEGEAKETVELVPGPKEKPHEGGHQADKPDRRLKPLTLYTEGDKEFPYHGYKWAMAIDLTTCTGCNACVVACQSENNIPVVGKEQVTRGREMHWLRIDRYYEGDPFDPVTSRPTSSRCRACTARTRRASWSAPSAPPSTATTDSTTWSTTAASARATARTTAPTRCGASTSSSSPITRPAA